MTVTTDAQGPAEVFVNLGRAGTDSFALAEAIGRLLSVILRLEKLGTSTERLELAIEQLHGIGGRHGYVSVPHAVAEALKIAEQACKTSQTEL